MSKNNLLVICNYGYSNALLMTYIDEKDDTFEPLSLQLLDKYLKNIYSRNGEDLSVYTLDLGDTLGSKMFNEILENDDLCEPFDYTDVEKQEKDNIKDFKKTVNKKVPEMDKDGKPKKDEDGKTIFTTGTKKEQVDSKTFKKILYKTFSIYYKDKSDFVEIKCAKLCGQGLNKTSLAARFNEDSIIENDDHVVFKLYNTKPKVKSTKQTEKKEKKDKTVVNKQTKAVTVKGAKKDEKDDKKASDKSKTIKKDDKKVTDKSKSSKKPIEKPDSDIQDESDLSDEDYDENNEEFN